MKQVKRIVSVMIIVLVLISAMAPAYADCKPTASYQKYSSTQTVRRGQTAKLVFTLNSGSYARRSGVFRSRFTMLIYKGSRYTGYGKDVLFTGNFRYILSWNVPRRMATGRYTILYCTGYRANGRCCWRATPTRSASVTMR